jgi:hypothetical protein
MNPTDVRHAWDSTIYYLDLAEQNQITQDSTDLRQESQTALDNLDGILRLDFRSAIVGALSRTVQVSRMAATDTDLYLLDALRGNVLRAFMTDQGYEVDPSFKCDPGQYDTTVVDALVDLEALPMSNIYNARVLAMDAKGAWPTPWPSRSSRRNSAGGEFPHFHWIPMARTSTCSIQPVTPSGSMRGVLVNFPTCPSCSSASRCPRT